VKLWLNGGPQFKSDEFLSFLRNWDISNACSSPHHPQSNGYVESAVKSMKKLIAGSLLGYFPWLFTHRMADGIFYDMNLIIKIY
jgi:hypothetical protein